jgi:hypothetical protein
VKTPFSEILQRAIDATPGAIGGAFAAEDGETVDYVSPWDRHDWASLTAHYGVLLAHVQSALHTFHFGEAEIMMICHQGVDVLVSSVEEGYYALLVVGRPRSLAAAMHSLTMAAVELRREMA